MLMSYQSDTVFCQECFGHIHIASEILRECGDSPCTTDHFERIGFHFTQLASEARSNRLGVLATYAQAMASYTRYLSNKSPTQISQTDRALLRDGIDIGLGCQQGVVADRCIEQNFDRLWPVVAELRAYIEHAGAP